MDVSAIGSVGEELNMESVGRPMACVLKEFTAICNESKCYKDKLAVLPTTWQKVVEYMTEQPDKNLNEQIFIYLYADTIRIILDCKWLKVCENFKIGLAGMFEKCLQFFGECNSILVKTVGSLVRLVTNPWQDPALLQVINDNVNQQELEAHFKNENMMLMCMRLRVLNQSKNEELALRLINAVYRFNDANFKSQVSEFFMAFYIITFTNKINEIESFRAMKKRKQLRSAEIKLAEIYMSLAEIFKKQLGITREVVLTSFSLNPNRAWYRKMKRLHRQMKQRNPDFPAIDLTAFPPHCGTVMVNSPSYDPYTVKCQFIDECKMIGLSDYITSDLVSIVNNQRFRKLSWMLKWHNLKSECKKYMKLGPELMRNEYKELKYLKKNLYL